MFGARVANLVHTKMQFGPTSDGAFPIALKINDKIFQISETKIVSLSLHR